MSGLFPALGVFLDLTGRAVVVLGCDLESFDLAQRCHACGASVRVFDPAPAQGDAAAPFRIERRRWRAADLRGAHLLIIARSEKRWARAAARAPTALIARLGTSEPPLLSFGANAFEGALSVAVHAPGAPAAVTHAAQAALLRHAPQALAEFVGSAGRARAQVDAQLVDESARAAFWSHVSQKAMTQQPSNDVQWNAFIEATLRSWLAH